MEGGLERVAVEMSGVEAGGMEEEGWEALCTAIGRSVFGEWCLGARVGMSRWVVAEVEGGGSRVL